MRKMAQENSSGIRNIKGPAEVPMRRQSNARERLLEAASDLMGENDTINVSLRDVAKRAQLNSSLIKYYFGNKDRLLLEVVEHDHTPVIAEMRAVADGNENAETKLRALIRIMIVALHRYPYSNRLLMAMLRDFAPEHSQMVSDSLVKPMMVTVLEVLKAGMASGEFKPHNPDFMWLNIAGACAQGFSIRAFLRHVYQRGPFNEQERDAYGEQIATILIDGLRS